MIVPDLYSLAEHENVLLLFQRAVMIHKPSRHGDAQIPAQAENKAASATCSVANLRKHVVPSEGRTRHSISCVRAWLKFGKYTIKLMR